MVHLVKSHGHERNDREWKYFISDQCLDNNKCTVARGCSENEKYIYFEGMSQILLTFLPHIRVGNVGFLTLRTSIKKVLVRSIIASDAENLILEQVELGED